MQSHTTLCSSMHIIQLTLCLVSAVDLLDTMLTHYVNYLRNLLPTTTGERALDGISATVFTDPGLYSPLVKKKLPTLKTIY